MRRTAGAGSNAPYRLALAQAGAPQDRQLQWDTAVAGAEQAREIVNSRRKGIPTFDPASRARSG